jgi:hypothetical protein
LNPHCNLPPHLRTSITSTNHHPQAIFHVLLITHGAVRPRCASTNTNNNNRGGGSGGMSLLPEPRYVAALIASLILLVLAVAGGAVVMQLTKAHCGELDRANGRTAWCGKRRYKCYPRTLEGFVFDASCVCLAFSSVAL